MDHSASNKSVINRMEELVELQTELQRGYGSKGLQVLICIRLIIKKCTVTWIN